MPASLTGKPPDFAVGDGGSRGDFRGKTLLGRRQGDKPVAIVLPIIYVTAQSDTLVVAHEGIGRFTQGKRLAGIGKRWPIRRQAEALERFKASSAMQRESEYGVLAWPLPASAYWRMKLYADDPRDLSRSPTLEHFLRRYGQFIRNCRNSLKRGGKLALLMGDYHDREAGGQVPLVFHTKHLAFNAGLRQHCTDIIRFSHGASSSQKAYRRSFIPGLHDVCMIFERP